MSFKGILLFTQYFTVLIYFTILSQSLLLGVLFVSTVSVNSIANRIDEGVGSKDKITVMAGSRDYNAYMTYNAANRAESIFDKLKLLQQALVLKPDIPEAYNNLGIVLNKVGRSMEAAHAWRTGASLPNIKPGMRAVFENNVGFLLQSKHPSSITHQKQALVHFDTALTLLPHYVDARTNKALALSVLGQHSKALEEYQRIVQLKELSTMTASDIKDQETTLPITSKALIAAQLSAPALLTLSNIFFALGRPSDSVRTLGIVLFNAHNDNRNCTDNKSCRNGTVIGVGRDVPLDLQFTAANNAAKILLEMDQLGLGCELTDWVMQLSCKYSNTDSKVQRKDDNVINCANLTKLNENSNRIHKYAEGENDNNSELDYYLLYQAATIRYTLHRRTCFWRKWEAISLALRAMLRVSSSTSTERNSSHQHHSSLITSFQRPPLLSPFESLMMGPFLDPHDRIQVVTATELRIPHSFAPIEKSSVKSLLNDGQTHIARSSTSMMITNTTASQNKTLKQGCDYRKCPLRVGYISVDYRQHVMCYLTRALFKEHADFLHAVHKTHSIATRISYSNQVGQDKYDCDRTSKRCSCSIFPVTVQAYALAADNHIINKTDDAIVGNSVDRFANIDDDVDANCRQDIKNASVKFLDVSLNNSLEFSHLVSSKLQLDVLVDLMGHTTAARRDLVNAVRSGNSGISQTSTILVNYLGYPGTSGWIQDSPSLQSRNKMHHAKDKHRAQRKRRINEYILVDTRVVPPEHDFHFLEKLLVLPSVYPINDHKRRGWKCPATPSFPSKLEKNGTASEQCSSINDSNEKTLCNFNKIDKLDPKSFRVWAGVMRRIPRSRLLLLSPTKKDPNHDSDTNDDGCTFADLTRVKVHLYAELAAAGVHISRLSFLPRGSRTSYMHHFCKCDLFLDTIMGYGAHTTAADALWMGVPVVSLQGVFVFETMCLNCKWNIY